jgi:hypothetical protein
MRRPLFELFADAMGCGIVDLMYQDYALGRSGTVLPIKY